jgi:ABC-type maltose transport system permease subunit
VLGLIKAIPADLYEASAMAGAKPLTNFFKITMPLIAKPLTPLLISAFAFNFNNFVLIALLTDGRPDLPQHQAAGRHDRHPGQLHLPHRLHRQRPELRPGRGHQHADLSHGGGDGDRQPAAQDARQADRRPDGHRHKARTRSWRVIAAHAFLWVLMAFTLFPLLAVISISLRPGNFATGSLIPSTISFEHWKLALGIS